MNNRRTSPAEPTSAGKREALDAYDVWVEREFAARRRHLAPIWITIGVAATVAVCITLALIGGGDDSGDRPKDPSLPPVAADEIDVGRVMVQVRQLSLSDHVQLSRAVGAALGARLLTPDGEWMRRKPAGPQAGVHRILNRGVVDLGAATRGGGAYFSFTTQSNCYNDVPDIELQNWEFSSGFMGGNRGLVSRLTVPSVDSVGLGSIPAYMLFSGESFYEHCRKTREERPAATVGGVYAVRSLHLRKSDVLAVVEVLEKDDYGVTFAWKVLKTFPAIRRGRR